MIEEKTYTVSLKNDIEDPDRVKIDAMSPFSAAVAAVEIAWYWHDMATYAQTHDYLFRVFVWDQHGELHRVDLGFAFTPVCTGGWEMCTKCGCALCTCKCHER